MLDQRKYVASIAGFDPTAGAGVLADIKCFEQHKVYGFGVCSALTVQSDERFMEVRWLDAAEIIAQLRPLFSKFDVVACKIGLISDLTVLKAVITYLRSVQKDLKLVLDPVLKSSSGFEFHQWNSAEITGVLQQIDLITPNYEEMLLMGNSLQAEEAAILWSKYCPVLLKGGHREAAPGTDLLFSEGRLLEFKPVTPMVYQKHGSGCVLSAAVTANLALGMDLENASRLAKRYIEYFLNSNQSLLGHHHHD